MRYTVAMNLLHYPVSLCIQHMEVPHDLLASIFVHSSRIASRLRREPVGGMKLNGFIRVALTMSREIWGGPLTALPDDDVVLDVLDEIWEIAILVDDIAEAEDVFVCYLLSLRIVFVLSFTIFDIFALV